MFASLELFLNEDMHYVKSTFHAVSQMPSMLIRPLEIDNTVYLDLVIF